MLPLLPVFRQTRSTALVRWGDAAAAAGGPADSQGHPGARGLHRRCCRRAGRLAVSRLSGCLSSPHGGARDRYLARVGGWVLKTKGARGAGSGEGRFVWASQLWSLSRRLLCFAAWRAFLCGLTSPLLRVSSGHTLLSLQDKPSCPLVVPLPRVGSDARSKVTVYLILLWDLRCRMPCVRDGAASELLPGLLMWRLRCPSSRAPSRLSSLLLV